MVSNLNSVKTFAKYLKDNDIQINGLINCAGIYGPISNALDVDMEVFTKAIEVNFLGTAYMCSSIGPLLTSKTNKKIINYSGGGAAGPFPNYSAYSTSKVAIVRYTENTAIELQSSQFDVNCISPGFVLTRLHQDTVNAGESAAGSDFYQKTKEQLDGGGISPEKAVELSVFLLSSESDGITGKFLAAPWDGWQADNFQQRCREDKDFAVLRRIDDKIFFKK